MWRQLIRGRGLRTAKRDTAGGLDRVARVFRGRLFITSAAHRTRLSRSQTSGLGGRWIGRGRRHVGLRRSIHARPGRDGASHRSGGAGRQRCERRSRWYGVAWHGRCAVGISSRRRDARLAPAREGIPIRGRLTCVIARLGLAARLRQDRKTDRQNEYAGSHGAVTSTVSAAMNRESGGEVSGLPGIRVRADRGQIYGKNSIIVQNGVVRYSLGVASLHTGGRRGLK